MMIRTNRIRENATERVRFTRLDIVTPHSHLSSQSRRSGDSTKAMQKPQTNGAIAVQIFAMKSAIELQFMNAKHNVAIRTPLIVSTRIFCFAS